MEEITPSNVQSYSFKPFRKTASLRARLLTETDYHANNGVIQTPEGISLFSPGDYLAHGTHDEEWPITNKYIQQHYRRISEPDAEGFAEYQAQNIRNACQIDEPFLVRHPNGRIHRGKAGDYLVVHDTNDYWIIDQVIFEETYQALTPGSED